MGFGRGSELRVGDVGELRILGRAVEEGVEEKEEAGVLLVRSCMIIS